MQMCMHVDTHAGTSYVCEGMYGFVYTFVIDHRSKYLSLGMEFLHTVLTSVWLPVYP